MSHLPQPPIQDIICVASFPCLCVFSLPSSQSSFQKVCIWRKIILTEGHGFVHHHFLNIHINITFSCEQGIFTCAQYVFDKVSELEVSTVEKWQEQEQWSNNNFPDLLGLSEFSGARTCQFEYLPICPFQGSNKIGPFSKSLANLESLVPAYRFRIV